MGQMIKDEKSHTAEVAFAVSDDMHNRGIGSELLAYLILLAKREGLLGFTAEVLAGEPADAPRVREDVPEHREKD